MYSHDVLVPKISKRVFEDLSPALALQLISTFIDQRLLRRKDSSQCIPIFTTKVSFH